MKNISHQHNNNNNKQAIQKKWKNSFNSCEDLNTSTVVILEVLPYIFVYKNALKKNGHPPHKKIFDILKGKLSCFQFLAKEFKQFTKTIYQN